jgi:hypothetical protein
MRKAIRCWKEVKILQTELNIRRKYKKSVHTVCMPNLISQPSLDISPSPLRKLASYRVIQFRILVIIYSSYDSLDLIFHLVNFTYTFYMQILHSFKDSVVLLLISNAVDSASLHGLYFTDILLHCNNLLGGLFFTVGSWNCISFFR